VIVTSYSSSERFEANQARPKMGVLAYNLLHMIRLPCPEVLCARSLCFYLGSPISGGTSLGFIGSWIQHWEPASG
jgi:hypothetical protein